MVKGYSSAAIRILAAAVLSTGALLVAGRLALRAESPKQVVLIPEVHLYVSMAFVAMWIPFALGSTGNWAPWPNAVLFFAVVGAAAALVSVGLLVAEADPSPELRNRTATFAGGFCVVFAHLLAVGGVLWIKRKWVSDDNRLAGAG